MEKMENKNLEVFIIQVFFGITGLAWAQPVADLLSILLVAVLYAYIIRKMESKTKGRAVGKIS